MSKKKYLLIGGPVRSGDGQTHNVGPTQLVDLYGLDANECILCGTQYEVQAKTLGLVRDSLVVLTPRDDGNYGGYGRKANVPPGPPPAFYKHTKNGVIGLVRLSEVDALQLSDVDDDDEGEVSLFVSLKSGLTIRIDSGPVADVRKTYDALEALLAADAGAGR